MSQVALTTLVAGTNENVNDVMADLIALRDAINSGLNSVNLAANAGIVGTQLSAAAGIVGTQLAPDTVTATQIAPGAIGASELSAAALAANDLTKLAQSHHARVHQTGQTQVFTTGGVTDLDNFGAASEDFDLPNNDQHNTVTATNRLTCTKAGLYLAQAQIAWGTHAGTVSQALGYLQVNGSTLIASAVDDLGAMQLQALCRLAATDFVSLKMAATGSGDLLTSGTLTTWLSWTLLSV